MAEPDAHPSDGFVRPATRDDVPAIAGIQARAWRLAYAEVLGPEELAALTPDRLAQAWQRAVADPPSPAHRVWVARSGPVVVGFAALAADGGTGDLVALAVDPDRQRQGHGSRLLAAVADGAAEAGLSTLHAWAPHADRPLTQFLVSAGFAPDGTRRRHRGGDGRDVVEIRLTTRVGAAADR